ncbi:head-tail connector protein [Dickeya solani]|uniref:Head-tail connector protein n=1 Tax=Dickeya solani TaxID=1089444 RepID=A0ABU4EHB3_9GAMM|nr:head-tail connector protein [Dickeya solani]MCZ0823706.1 head-tail connector protein [Dickeya solani]MDV6995613.1 head-tail connector protein [Dickeya solani]MDV7002892.1 head-tail connector protein [Dickeya solani]MDV7036668.1 head-tail connector protein [Dickeya solani]MDV7043421.1 head-tail connector protein [Dickeya solani]
MLLTLDQIKRQLRLESDYTDEDELLTLLGNAVQRRTETYVNRNLYSGVDDIPATDPDGLVLSDDIRLAMLLLLTHYYENRSSVSDFEKTEVPQGYSWLVGPYRYIPL